MGQMSNYQKDCIFSMLNASLHEVSQSVFEFLDLQTSFSTTSFIEEDQSFRLEKELKDLASIHIIYKGPFIREGACYIKRKDLKLLSEQLLDGESNENPTEFMVDLGKEFTNLVCNRLIGALEGVGTTAYSSFVPVFRDPYKPVSGRKEDGPFGVLHASLLIGATKIPCDFYLVLQEKGLNQLLETLPKSA